MSGPDASTWCAGLSPPPDSGWRKRRSANAVERRRPWRREAVWRRSPRRTAAPNESEPLGFAGGCFAVAAAPEGIPIFCIPMIRSNDRRILIVDKLRFLWVLCVLADMKERGQKITWFNLENELGQETHEMFRFYRDIAMDNKYIAPDSQTLTDKGQRAVANWRHIQAKLFDF